MKNFLFLGTPIEKENWISCILANEPRDGEWVGVILKRKSQYIVECIEKTINLFPIDLEDDLLT